MFSLRKKTVCISSYSLVFTLCAYLGTAAHAKEARPSEPGKTPPYGLVLLDEDLEPKEAEPVRVMASSSMDGTVRIWNASTGVLLHTMVSTKVGCSAIDLSIDAQRIVAGNVTGPTTAARGRITVWDSTSGIQLHTWERPYPVTTVAFSPDGALIASDEHREIRLWSTQDARLVRTLTDHAGPIHAIDFSPNGEFIVSGGGDYAESERPQSSDRAQTGEDFHIRLWSASDGRLVRSHDSGDIVSSMTFSPDGQSIAHGTVQAHIDLWNPSTDTRRTRLENLVQVNAIAYSPDGKHLVSNYTGNAIAVWDASTGARLGVFGHHPSRVQALAYSRDGRLIASGSDDQTIRLWNASNGTLIRTLHGHTDGICAIAF